MADIRISLQGSLSNGVIDSWPTATQSITQLNAGASGRSDTTSTSATNVDYGSITTGNVGIAWFSNTDATHSCDVGIGVSAVFYPVCRLLPGESWAFRITPSVQLQLQAVSGTPQIQYKIWQA